MFDVLDLTPLLRKGVNHFAAIVTGPTGVPGYSALERIGFFLDGFALCGKRRMPLRTYGGHDGDWQVCLVDWIIPSGQMCSLPTVYQEHIDAEREPKNWKRGSLDKRWHAAWSIGPEGTPPWRHMEPRSVPLLEERRTRPPLVWKGKASRRIIEPRENLRIRFNDDKTVQGKRLVDDAANWTLCDKRNVFTFDFGKPCTIRPGIEVKNVRGEVRIEFFYDLGLGDRPTAHRGFDTPREGFCDTFRPPPGASHWEALAPHGMRYLTVKVTGHGHCTFRLRPKTVEYPFPRNASFECDDPLIRKIWETSVESLRCSTNDTVVDCNSRENMCWNLDACISSKASFHTFGETRMWRRCMSLLAQGIEQDGVAHANVPTELSFMMLFDATMRWVWSCHDYYLATGDTSLLKETADAMRRFLGLCARHMGSEGLFAPPAYTWHFVDIAPIDKRAYSLPINALLLLAARSAQKTAVAVQDRTLMRIASGIEGRLKNALPHFFDTKAGCFADRVLPAKQIMEAPPGWPFWSSHTQKFSLHGNALACIAGVGPAGQRRSAAQYLARRLSRKLGEREYVGPGWIEMICTPLFDHEHDTIAESYVRKIYGGALKRGVVAWPEHWNLEHHFSHNTGHGWGAAVNTLLVERVVGLRPIGPGWNSILFGPRPKLVRQLRYSIQLTVGLVTVEFNNGRVAASFPRGTSFVYYGRKQLGTGAMQQLSQRNP
jgi:hypothetical protein